MASAICCEYTHSFVLNYHVSTGAKCCTIFSLTGIIFLLVIGLLIQRQPLYIKGINKPAEAAQGCYEGGNLQTSMDCSFE